MTRVAKSIKADRKVPYSTQKKVRKAAPSLVGKVVIVKTLFGTFTGRLRKVGSTSIRLLIFNGSIFIPIIIPFGFIFAIFPFILI